MKPALLILAAGMGNRFGSLKQIEPIGPEGETLIDYTVFDAIRAGFGKIVFVIRESFASAFEEKIGCKFRSEIEVAYAFQPIDIAVESIPLMPSRSKPWGTGHAVLAAKEIIREPFAVVNADDFYGFSTLKKIAGFLKQEVTPHHFCMAGFILKNTLSENGPVSRGVCQIDERSNLRSVIETLNIERVGDAIHFKNKEMEGTLPEDTLVSMNCWGFHPAVFKILESQFNAFVKKNYTDPEIEFYIPTVINDLIQQNAVKVTILPSDEQWYGVTYKADKPVVQKAIAMMVENGLYPKPLWAK